MSASSEETLRKGMDEHMATVHGMVPQYVPPVAIPTPPALAPTVTIEVTQEELSTWEQVKAFLESKFPMIFLLVLVTCWPAFSQATHSVTLGWTASATVGVTYNVLHSATATGTFAVVNSAPITGTSYVDTVNLSGFWEVVALDNAGDTSISSNEATVPNAPTALKAVAN